MSTPQQRRKKTGAGIWIPLIICVVYPLILGGFAVQTYFFADGILPYDSVLMKIITVFSFDGCSIIYAFAETLYPFRRRVIKEWTRNMWGVTFVLSLAASFVYMFLLSQNQLQAVTGWLHMLCILIILLAFALAVIFLTIAIRSEITAWLEGVDEFAEDEAYNKNDTLSSAQQMEKVTAQLQAVTQELKEVRAAASDPLLQRLPKQRQIPTNGVANGHTKDTL